MTGDTKQLSELEELFGKAICAYSIEQATEDGILFDVRTASKGWENGIFSHITSNLLEKGYLKEDETLNMPNLLDLVRNTQEFIRIQSKNFTEHNDFFTGKIELPSGQQQQINVRLNELNKFTIMLPEDD